MEIFSPVVRYETARLMIVQASLQQWIMTSIDVKAAFLYGELDEELYMEQPKGFQVKSSKRLIFRLKRAIYRLKQAAKQWWITLTKSMAKLRFRRAVSDSGVFILTSSEGPSIIVIIYVDDAIFMGPDRNTVTKAKESFMALWEC